MELPHLTPTIIETYLKYGLKKSFEREGELKDKTVIFQLKEGEETFKERITYYVGKKKSSVVVEGKGDREFMTDDLKRLNDLLETDKPKVFINYAYAFDGGKNKNKVKAMVEELGFEPVILEEQVNHGQLVLEKLIGAISEADYGVVLLSPDDEMKTGEYKPRANVMIELGMLLMHFSNGKASNGGKKNLAVINYGLKQEEIAKYLSDFSGFSQILYTLKAEDRDKLRTAIQNVECIDKIKETDLAKLFEPIEAADEQLKADLAKELAVLYPAMTL